MILPQSISSSEPAYHHTENPMLSALFESNLLAVAVLDESGRFLSLNEGFCTLFQIERTVFIGKPLGLLTSLTVAQLASLSQVKRSRYKAGHNNSFVIDHNRPGNSPVRIKLSFENISFSGGSATFMLAFDISEDIVKSEANASKHLQNALDNVKDLVWSVDTDFNLISANDAFNEEMEQHYGLFCAPGQPLLIPERFTSEILEKWKSCYEHVLSGFEFTTEISRFAPPGTEPGWVDVSFNPIYNEGKIAGVACLLRDITKRKEAEKLLQESQLRLAEAHDLAKMGSWETDLHNMSLTWSPEAFRIFDLEPKSTDLFHHHFLEFVHPEDRQRVKKNFTLSLADNGINNIEYRIITASGETKDVEQRWHILRDSKGEATAAIGSFQDITVRKNAERRMLESDLLYRSLIEQATDTICITDPSFYFLDVNPSGCAAFGYTKEELLGKHVSEVIFEEDQAQNPLRLSDLKAGKTIINERRIKCKNGKAIYVELTGKALYNGKIMFYGRDISERKATERFLKESNERYNLISKATNDMVWDWDLSTQRVHRNMEGWKKIFGYKTDSILAGDAMDWDSRVHPEDRATVERVNREIKVSKKDFFEVECRVRREDGSYAYVHDQGYIMRNEAGDAVRLIGATQDITERKKAALKLENSEARFRLLVQNSSDLISILNDRAYYLYCSSAVTKILGYEPEYMEGKNAFSFIHPQDVEIIKEQFRHTRSRKLFETSPFRILNKAGEWRWLESRVTDMSDNPQIGGFVFNSRDVTDRVNAAEQIKRLSLIAKETPNSIVITNPAGEVVWTNEAFTRITEYSFDEIKGKTPGGMLQGPGTSAVTVKYMRQRIKQRRAFECDILNYTKTGRQYWLRVQCQPQFDKEGNLEAFFAMQTDITKEKETERILKTSEENYRYLFNNNPTSIIVWDLETLKVLEVNNSAEQLYGYRHKEFLSKSVLDFSDEPDRVQIKAFAAEALRLPEFKVVRTWKVYNRAGEVMYMNISSNKITYHTRPVIFSMGTNVTDKLALEKLLEEERLARQKEITEAVISAQENERHELGRELHDNINQILASSLLYLGLAKTNYTNEPNFINKADELVQSAIVEVRNLSHSLIPPSLNDSELLEALSKVMDTARLSGRLKIELEAPGFDETVVPDNLKLTLFRIVQEQLSNILKHAGATYVKLSVLLHKENLQLVILDNGNGFNISKKHSGVGLLNIKTRVALFDGKLTIKSSPGEGCELTVTFSKSCLQIPQEKIKG